MPLLFGRRVDAAQQESVRFVSGAVRVQSLTRLPSRALRRCPWACLALPLTQPHPSLNASLTVDCAIPGNVVVAFQSGPTVCLAEDFRGILGLVLAMGGLRNEGERFIRFA